MGNYIIKISPQSRPVIDGGPTKPDAEFLCSAVGGEAIEIAVTLIADKLPGLCMIANGQGIDRAAVNAVATMICSQPDVVISGTAIIIKETDKRYEALTFAEAETVMKALTDIIEGVSEQ